MATILGSELMAADIDRKHDKMHASAFVFFRATYWRWAETILDICPELADAPSVLAVGDIHLENYGTWRDAEGRLAWGVNDFDEAAEAALGFELANLHLGVADRRSAIQHDLGRRKRGWLADAGKRAAKACTQDFNAWRTGR